MMEENKIEMEMPKEIITFDEELIPAVYGVNGEYGLDEEEFSKGVKDASSYIGQFSALINSGIDSETAIVIMLWIREDKLNKDNIDMQINLSKIESVKIKREIL